MSERPRPQQNHELAVRTATAIREQWSRCQFHSMAAFLNICVTHIEAALAEKDAECHRGLDRTLGEAMNSGDGSYRP